MNSLLSLILDFLTIGLYSQYNTIHAPLGFQQAGSPSFYNLIDFHDYIIIFLIFIFLIVIWHLIWALNLSKNLYSVLLLFVLLSELPNFLISQIETFKEFRTFEMNLQQYCKFLEKYQLEQYAIFNNMIHVLYAYYHEHKNENKIYNFFGKYLLIMMSFLLFLIHSVQIHTSVYAFINTQSYYKVTEDTIETLEYKNILKSAQYFLYKQYLLVQKQLKRLTHAPLLEIIWTIFPSFILLAIAVPSLVLLYQLDSVEPVSLCIKVIGHQWYWTYEIGATTPLFSDLLPKIMVPTSISGSFDSYMITEDISVLRLLQADNGLFVPMDVPLTFMITSTDVLHSWAVPSLGIKVDAIPGRLNRVGVTVLFPGIFYGQCSELCGINHGFMPINIYSYIE